MTDSDDDHVKITSTDDGKCTITLLEKADEFSVIHGLAPIWLDDLKADAARDDAPLSIMDDWEKAKAFIGHRGTGRITDEERKKWVQAFDSYLMEGKSPSHELVGAFRYFRRWPIVIYRKAKRDINLNDDIRGVFDRMLATDGQINEMKPRRDNFKKLLGYDLFSANVRRGLVRLWLAVCIPWTLYWWWRYEHACSFGGCNEGMDYAINRLLLPIASLIAYVLAIWVWRGFFSAQYTAMSQDK